MNFIKAESEEGMSIAQFLMGFMSDVINKYKATKPKDKACSLITIYGDSENELHKFEGASLNDFIAFTESKTQDDYDVYFKMSGSIHNSIAAIYSYSRRFTLYRRFIMCKFLKALPEEVRENIRKEVLATNLKEYSDSIEMIFDLNEAFIYFDKGVEQFGDIIGKPTPAKKDTKPKKEKPVETPKVSNSISEIGLQQTVVRMFEFM